MAPNPPVLSSAVIVPEAENPTDQGHIRTKRRQSSISTDDSKRPRLSSPQEQPRKPTDVEPQPSTTLKERAGKDSEERKRGKRLFGALLGTLNQSSSSVAQRRRGDIERKQQEKLKIQAQEHDEQRKKDREALLSSRRLERDIYVKEAAKTRREHELACASFLHTKTEPKLYYKPWDLLPEQKARIDDQIKDAQAAAEKQIDDETNAVTRSKDAKNGSSRKENDKPPKPADGSSGNTTNIAGDGDGDAAPDATGNDSELHHQTGSSPHKRRASEASREVPDDGGDDFVKGDEDDVIY